MHPGLGRPRVFSWVNLDKLLKAKPERFSPYLHCEYVVFKISLKMMATIEARGELAPLQDAGSKVAVLFCADATPFEACIVI